MVGVDPGGQNTGIVVRRGDQLLYHALCERPGRLSGRAILDPGWLDLCAARVRQACREAGYFRADGRRVVVAVEGVNSPTGQMGQIALAGLLGTAAVAAAVIQTVTDLSPDSEVLVVPPGRHGALPLQCYPAELVSDAERRKGLRRVGGGKLKDCRSAWDIAGAAVTQLRVERLGKGA